MLCIATIGPMGPMNSFYGATSRIMLAMGRKGQLPSSFAQVDPVSGTPRTANLLLAALTIGGPFLGKKMLVPLTNVSALAFIFACTMVSFSCYKMRLTEPDLPRPYKVPGGQVRHRPGLFGRFAYRPADGSSRQPRYPERHRMEHSTELAGSRLIHQSAAQKKNAAPAAEPTVVPLSINDTRYPK